MLFVDTGGELMFKDENGLVQPVTAAEARELESEGLSGVDSPEPELRTAWERLLDDDYN